MDKPYTFEEAADLLRVSPRTLRRRLATHRMGQFRLGGRVLFSRVTLHRHLTDGTDFPLIKYIMRNEFGTTLRRAS
jgi:excisionase family DNA binding protein